MTTFGLSASFQSKTGTLLLDPFVNVAIYRVRQKSSPLKFFAIFLATARNFNIEFYRFIYRIVLHLTAKWNMILLKNDEVIDFW